MFILPRLKEAIEIFQMYDVGEYLDIAKKNYLTELKNQREKKLINILK